MSISFRKIRLLLIGTLPIAVAIYAIWYWFTDHQQLVGWYKSINPSFYQAETWEVGFFTREVKKQGNGWCLAAFLAAILGAYFCWKTPFPALPKFVLKKRQALIYGCIAIFGTILSLKANFHTAYSPDEVFSSLNFAALPIFQTLSYYALPNNHPLFNTISGSLFFLGGDPVMIGRIVSLVCFVGVLCFSWYFLGKWRISFWLRSVVLLVLALQFPVWGFSGQARGYEMVLLFSCLSFGAFYNYYVTSKKHWLLLLTFCNVVGMLTIPTYLYWWAGLILASLIFQISARQWDWVFICYLIIGFSISFISYLPLLTFSGLQSITQNKYVRAADITRWHFLTHLNEQKYFDVLFKEWFCTENAVILIGIIISITPILLFIFSNKKKENRTLGVIYFSIVFAFLSMAILMLKFPFTRNLIAQGHLVLLVSSITLFQFFRSNKIQSLLGVILLLYSGCIAKENYKKIPYHLYYYDVKGYLNKASQFKTDVEQGSTVYLDDECFYSWYILKNKFPERGIIIEYNKPHFNNQDYCIMPHDSFPPTDTSLYLLLEKGVDMQVFKKRE